MYDGNVKTDWASKAQRVGAWIEIKFAAFNALTKLEFRHRFGGISSGENFKDINLSFSDGTQMLHALQNGDKPEWYIVELNPIVEAKYVRLTGITVFGTHNNGFSEIKIFGCPVNCK